MAWQDRLRESAYTGASGKRLPFLFEESQEEFTHKGTPVEISDADGSYTKPMGITSRRYPMKVILSGENYDAQANDFMDLLAERGEGVLEHPVYGRKSVVPVGLVRRTENLSNQANQAIIEVEFFETTGVLYSDKSQDSKFLQANAVDMADTAHAEQVLIDGVEITESPVYAAKYSSVKELAGATIGSIEQKSNINSESLDAGGYNSLTLNGFNASYSAISDSIDRGKSVLFADPLTLAMQTQKLISQPSNYSKGFNNRIDGYSTFLDKVLKTDPLTNEPTPATTEIDLAIVDLFASAGITSLAVSATKTEYQNRSDAVEMAEKLLEFSDKLSYYRDQSYLNVDKIDTGISWGEVQRAISISTGILIEQSFKLSQKRSVVLSSARSIIDLVYELTGAVDESLDEFISENDLSGDEIIEIKKGREIVYYVK